MAFYSQPFYSKQNKNYLKNNEEIFTISKKIQSKKPTFLVLKASNEIDKNPRKDSSLPEETKCQKWRWNYVQE